MIKTYLYNFMKAALIISCLFLYGCINNYQEVQNLGKKRLPVDEAINVESYLSQNGNVKAKLTSPLMTSVENNDSPKIEFPNTLHVDFFNDSTIIESRLFAKYGLFYQKKNLVFLRDSVIVFNTKKDTLRCEELWWDQDKQIIFTNTAVHIRKPDESIDGTGMVADQNFTKWTIYNAKGPINVADSMLPSEF